MTDTERARERLRSANPLPGRVEAEELDRFLSSFAERRDVMTDTRTPTGQDRSRVRRNRFRPVLAFVSAAVVCVFAIGAVLLVLRGGGTVEPANTTVPTPTTVPPATTVPEAPPPDAANFVTSVSNDPEYFSGMAIGPDGLPVVASYTFVEGEELGTVRLFTCTDPECTDPDFVDLLEAPWLGRTIELAVAPNRDTYLLVGDALYRFRDGNLAAVPAMFTWPSDDTMPVVELPVAFTADNRPVFVGAVAGQGLTLVVCDDAACARRTEVPLADGDFLRDAGAVVAGDTIRVVYAVGTPTGPPDPEAGYDGAVMGWTTHVATVTDIDGTPAVATAVAHDGLNEFPATVATDVSDNLVIWQYATAQAPPSVIACDDFACSSSAAVPAPGLAGWALWTSVTPDLTLMQGVVEFVYDADQHAAYEVELQRIAAEQLDVAGPDEPEPLETHIVVVRCTDLACTSTRRAAVTTRASWWYLNSFELEVTGDGTAYVLLGNDATIDAPGLWLHGFPPGTLTDVVEPSAGTVVVTGWSGR